MGGARAGLLRVPPADCTLVATPGVPADDPIPSFLAASDVLGTGWFGAFAAQAGPGKTVAVVGDGVVGLLVVPATERIIKMSRHEPWQKLAREFGATDTVTELGGGASPRSRNSSADSAPAPSSSPSAPRSRCSGPSAPPARGHVGCVGVALDGQELFFSHVHLHDGPAAADPPDPEPPDQPRQGPRPRPPLDMASEAQQAMVEWHAIKALLRCSPP